MLGLVSCIVPQLAFGLAPGLAFACAMRFIGGTTNGIVAAAKAAAKEIAKFTSEFLNARLPASEAFARVDASPTVPRAGRPAMLYYDRQRQLGHARKT